MTIVSEHYQRAQVFSAFLRSSSVCKWKTEADGGVSPRATREGILPSSAPTTARIPVPTPAAWCIHQAPTTTQLSPSMGCKKQRGVLVGPPCHPLPDVVVGADHQCSPTVASRGTGWAGWWPKLLGAGSFPADYPRPLLPILGGGKEPAAAVCLPPRSSPFPAMAPR